MDIMAKKDCIPPECCPKELAINRRCNPCKATYKRLQRREVKEAKITTRNNAGPTRNKYASVLCLDCKKQKNKNRCSECKTKYKRTKDQSYRDAKREKRHMSARNITEKVSGSINQQNPLPRKSDCTDNTRFNKQNKGKNTNDKNKTKCVRKRKPSSVKNTGNPQFNKQIEGESTLDKRKHIDWAEKTHKKKTHQNYMSKARKHLNKSPGRLGKFFKWGLINLAEGNVKRSLLDAFDESEKADDFNGSQKVEFCGNLYQKIVKDNPKGDLAYRILSAFSDELKGAKISTIRRYFKINHKKAKLISQGMPVSRKQNIRRFPEESKRLIIDFYEKDYVSRQGNSKRDVLKNGKVKKYLSFSVNTVYKMFQNEYPNIQVSESMFRALKPDHFRFCSDIPLVGCVCVYCENVRLKLFMFHGINSEYDLYDKLICEKDPNQRFRNFACIRKLCQKCCNWEEKIKSLLPTDCDFNKLYKWITWKAIKDVTKAGKPVVRRQLIPDEGPIDKYLDELITTDIMKPGQGFTFVEHFFRKTYQQKMYLDCRDSLKVGESVFIQHFSKNITIKLQREIKSHFWSQGQMSIHPTVIHLKTHENEELKRIVITHVSDIHSHSAQLVYYITKDCIDILSQKFPEVKLSKVYLWSDGCASQYKGKTSFFFLDQFEIPIERNFFGSEHGKGESDAETGIISKQYTNAIRSDEIVVLNASELQKFLAEKNKKKKNNIYRHIDEEDMKPIYQKFKDVQIGTLTGKCTRILHQIKPSGRKGYFLTRNYSCFCNSCSSGDFALCGNSQYSGGKFILRKLPSSFYDSSSENLNSDENYDEDEENGEELDSEITVESENKDIIIEKKELSFHDLQVDDLIVVTLRTNQGKIRQFGAKVKTVETESEINIVYLVQNFDQPGVLYLARPNDTDTISLEDIVMKLPEPEYFHRNRYIFHGKVLLNQ